MGDDLLWMGEAMKLAREAAGRGEIPVGAVVVRRGQDGTGAIVGQGFNLREVECDPSAHAEMVALREAGRALGRWRLFDCETYVTLEPCVMCAGALVNARVKRLIFGCRDPKAGAVGSLYQICADARLNHRLEVVEGVLGDEAAELLRDFFRARRG